MEPYYEFYSDLDQLLNLIETMKDKCRQWWIEDRPFHEVHCLSSEPWRELEDALTDIEDKLNDEPFFTTEE